MVKLLVVEDNPTILDMLTRRLLKRGYDVVTAGDGEEGCRLALSERPDVILLDMHLPVLDGFGAARRLEADPLTQAIPVIALTADAMAGDRERALAAGCDDYETKPIDLPRLLDKIEALRHKGGTP